MSRDLPVLLAVLRAPASMAGLGLAQWELLLRQAERCDMGASLMFLAQEQGLAAGLPAPVREQFEWLKVRASRHRQAVEWEVRQLEPVLATLGLPLVLLKGAAYALAGLPPAPGRLFSDIDILVPFEQLGRVEAALMLDGWVSNLPDPYDQRYYREWMHELPPMQHARRQSVLDVHHTILPRTASAKPDPAKLWQAAQPVAGHPALRVLAPADMVLHSAVHLFHEGEFDHGMRGLFDLHRLLVHFGAEPGFWDALSLRAHQMDVGRSLFYALRYTARLLGTPVPSPMPGPLAAAGPGAVQLALMDWLFVRVLRPLGPGCDASFGAVARLVLYLRGNWLRMPPLMLARHLLHKALLSKPS
ncbi:nucleotidyltransferase domain-containing protein [Massilia yuzhufengensis]|uniref:Uncharacterized nucleotidyltransferase n=1 Tax=Massilia yuzhufengensis TaxID=1164594 RepID=A0A1I1DRU5_9BURK|nr:nucleotidyltransferase family protein [Massilia yuzhufengensis]SFB75420.1 Uncharacterised nucleotidyltransferase [Massilia yuzhufengensis]